MRYIPLTDSDREAMLREIGVSSLEDLFSSVPRSVRRSANPDLPPAKSEAELRTYFGRLAAKNGAVASRGWLTFLGGGCYEHFIPTIVDALSIRGEFSTAYTPYQPEVAQGTLQAIFEFQSMMANLTEMEVANASMYDGASAVAEAILMGLRVTDGSNVYVSRGLHPEYREVIRSYLCDTEIRMTDLDVDAAGQTKVPDDLPERAVVVVGQPNFFGVLEPVEGGAETVHERKGFFVAAVTEPMAFGVIRGPGGHGADVVAGEAQSLGNPMSFGGPHVGFLAGREVHVRQMPGRLVGKTTDSEGREGYVLTLSTREQHIRREKATSNICTNQSLCALRTCIYLATLGERGVREVARRNSWAANRLRTALLALPGVKPLYTGPIFNEFALKLPISAEAFLSTLEKDKILGGISLQRWDAARKQDLLVTVTETKSAEELDRYVAAARRAL